MTNMEENKPNAHLSYKKLYNLIENEVNENKEEDLVDNKDMNKSMTHFSKIKNNNFIKDIHKIEKLSNHNPDIHFSGLNSKYSQPKKPNTELYPKNKNEITKKSLIDNEIEKNKEDENINNSSKKVILMKKEYKGIKCEKLNFTPISDYKIEPIINDSKYNIFFILPIPQKLINSISFSVHIKKTIYNEDFSMESYYIQYQFFFIGQKNVKKNNEDINYILFQVPVRKNTGKLILFMKQNEADDYYIGDINFQLYKHNLFFVKNVFYAMKEYNLTDNQLFSIYLDYFFDEKNRKDEELKKDLISSLLYHIDKFYGYIKLSGDIILRFLKYSFKYGIKPTNLNNIKVMKNGHSIDKNDYLLYNNLDNYGFNELEKKAIMNLIVQIYALNDKEFLLSLLKGNLSGNYIKIILDLLNDKILDEHNIIFPNDEDNIYLQDSLLQISETLFDINSLLRLSIGLTKCLNYIKERFVQIYNIVGKKIYDGYTLDLPKIENNANYKDIYKLLINLIKTNKKYKYQIIDFEQIAIDLVNYYSSGTLEEFYNVNDLLEELKSESLFNDRNMLQYKKMLHKKGCLLIREKLLNINQIMEFIFKQDVFYYHKKYRSYSHYNDPSIFSYIPITEKDPNYQANIKEMKRHQIWDLFDKEDKKIELYEAFLEQINKILELKHIFELFPEDEFDKNLSILIKNKIQEISGTISNINPEQYVEVFQIFKTYLICLDKNKISIFIPLINYDFNFKLIQYILQESQLKKVVNKYQDTIISFFLETNIDHNGIENDIVTILLLSENSDLCIEMLNKMERLVIKKKDFYSKEETKRFILFKLIFEKCKNIVENKKKGKYIKETLKIREELYDELDELNVVYDVINNVFDEENNFYRRLLLICDKDEVQIDNLNDKLNSTLQKCRYKISIFDKIEEYYNTFFGETKNEIITLLRTTIYGLRKKKLKELLNTKENEVIKDNPNFDYNFSVKESQNLKYKYSLFFMAIYKIVNINENFQKTENEIFESSRNYFYNTIQRIINQKESKQPFFEIPYTNEIMKVISNKNNNLEEEINFLAEEFKFMGKKEYIKQKLLEDLINFSNKSKISRLIEGIIYFIKAYQKIVKISITDFTRNLEKNLNILNNNRKITGQDIEKIHQFLISLNYDINKETSIINFFRIFLGKEESLLFIKRIKDSNLEIRNLNEFIDENENSQLQVNDIDNLLDVYTFYDNIMTDGNIKNDKTFHDQFQKNFLENKYLPIKMQGYLSCYGEIIQLYQLYGENSEMTVQKINNILNESDVLIFEEKNDMFTFEILYQNQKNERVKLIPNELDELKNKLLISSTNSSKIKKKKGKKDKEKKDLTDEFVNLLDSIKELIDTLNNLVKVGYPDIINLNLKVQNSVAHDEKNEKKILQDIIIDYKNIIKKYRSLVKKGYVDFPLLRFFYGKQLIQLHKKVKNDNKKNNIDISHLINSMALNKITNFETKFEYDNTKNNIENINNYLERLFSLNKIDSFQLLQTNIILKESYLSPDLYKYEKKFNNSELILNIINIYINITGNTPINDTILICNEETPIEKILCFLYRAIFCPFHILFTIARLECLELSITQNIIKNLNYLFNKKNRTINSVLLIIFQEKNSGIGRELKKIISDKKILNSFFCKEPSKMTSIFNDTELYSSKFAGYGKSTEIKHKIKDKNGIYNYLPIGGSFSRDYIIQNLLNLKLDINNRNQNYLHIDLSDTESEDLMDEILFKLLILRCIDSKEKVYYLGYKIKIFIEIPSGFVDFQAKYRILNLFKHTHIETLPPLRLEDEVYFISESPISIVAETLFYYENNIILEQNINLNKPIQRSAYECEIIINRHFPSKNNNYYQKTNFIKILSVQFIKFCNNIYFNPANLTDQNAAAVKKARKLVIKNFISLTKVFTCSPYDNILLGQAKSLKYMDKSNKYDIKEEVLLSLAKEKKEIFSFDKIKPSLVFFNKDGQSLSIISNCDKSDMEYKDLKELWNSQIYDKNRQSELIEYKSLSHEKFLDEIKILFSLDKMTIPEIKMLCETSGNYIFVSDNYIKMVRILLNIEAKIPTILMGETGVGKTKLMEILSTLYGNGKSMWKILQIHAGITDEDIVNFIDRITEEYRHENTNDYMWVFLDEINTCNSLGLITEIMCNHSYLGKKINDNFIFIGACNPYRLLTKKMRESGLVYYNMKDTSKLNNLVYTVNPLPHSLLNFVFDFGNLRIEDEQKYIDNTIKSIISEIIEQGLIVGLEKNVLDKVTENIIQTVFMCHKFICEIYDISSVSMREIRRFGIFFQFFIRYFGSENNTTHIADPNKKMLYSLNMSLYLCYYLRLNDKNDRNRLAIDLNKYFPTGNFIKFPEIEIKKITEQMNIEKSKGIALNRALRENLFTIFMCITNNVPLIIVGKPGTSKSLSFQILYNTMKGEYSESDLFKDKGKLYRYYYQGSEASTSKGIEKVFSKAIKAQAKNKNKNIITLVFFDEMGLAERSSNNPLKIIHYLLEKDAENSVPFLGISNWKLDASKINRALSLTITDYDIEDLKETATAIAEALDSELCDRHKEFFETLAETYFEYMQFNQNNKIENKDFHGNRDFYNLIKNSMSELINFTNKYSEKKFKKLESQILTDIGITCLERNFGGLEDSTTVVKNIFKMKFEFKYDDNYNLEHKQSEVDIIKTNIVDPNGRYLMLISEGNDASDIIKYVLKSIKKNYIELVGSKYRNDIKSGRYSEEILNKIKYIMETDNILILRDLDIIYPSLFDLFNQNFTCMGDKKFARIAFEYAKISSEVNPNFRVIIIVNQIKIEELKLDPPFLNRFEKHIITFRMLLTQKDIEISNKIMEYFDVISSYNNNKKLKLDLEKLMINCERHSIEGLIYKIKTEESTEKESKIVKVIFEKIVPTFCQDIIASIISSKMNKKYQDYNDMVLKIYQKNKCVNFESFFTKVKKRRNIIYTFSKITEEIIGEKDSLTNEHGTFTKERTEVAMIESIKSEGDLSFLLKSFTNSLNNLLILKFAEEDINKINLVDHIINNFENEYGVLKEKLILLIIHRQRDLKTNSRIKKKKIIPDYIPFINDDYYQIFIDNLQGKELYDITSMHDDKKKVLLNDFINKTYFIDYNIYSVLNYIKFTILYETEEINNKTIISLLSTKILKNEDLKKMLIKNIQSQSEGLKDIINEVFLTNVLDINDVDFFEVINSILIANFCKFLLKIIFHLLKQHILLQLLDKDKYVFYTKNSVFNEIINEELSKTNFVFVPQLKSVINANQIIIYNGLDLPESKIFLEKINNYINSEIYYRYVENEDSLRKKYSDEIEIEKAINDYTNELTQLIKNIKVEMDKYEFFKNIYTRKQTFQKTLFEDYLKFFIIKYLEKNAVNDYRINNYILSFFTLLLKLKLRSQKSKKNLNIPIDSYKFEYTQDEMIQILLFTTGYRDDIFTLFNILVQLIKYFPNVEAYLSMILSDNTIKYEISERNKDYTKTVNLILFNIIEALSRAILQYSIDLIYSDKNKFYEYFNTFTLIETNLQHLNNKYFLLNKELYNIGSIIKIREAYKYNLEQFERNYEKIIDNLLKQSIYLYANDYKSLYNIFLDLNEIFNETFVDKNDEYIDLMFFMFLKQYEIVDDENIRIKLIENFLNNPLLIRRSKIFLYDTLKEMKPEICDIKENNIELIQQHIDNFMNLTKDKLIKYKNLYKIYNGIKSNEFDEIILYIFETLSQSYFHNLLELYGNIYNKESCEVILLYTSLEYLKKAINYLDEIQGNKKYNKLMKLFSIAYIKTYIFYYVEINYDYFDLINFNDINSLFNKGINKEEFGKNTKIIYIWKKYCKKFENFHIFENYNFSNKKIPLHKQLFHKLVEEKKNNPSTYIFKESFIPLSNFNIYIKIISDFMSHPSKPNFNFEEINKNFDIFFCFLVNKIISYLYGNDKKSFLTRMKTLYLTTNSKLHFGTNGSLLYKNLLNDLQNSIFQKIADNPLFQQEFEILLYAFRFVFSTQMNKNNSKNFYNCILSKDSFKYINENYIPGSFPFINEFIKSYNDLEEKFKKVVTNGYYICKDCGYLYEILPCTLPYAKGKCPNGHEIGGIDHKCTKKDIRVFPDENSRKKYESNNSFESLCLGGCKQKYVDIYLKQKPKGIIKGYRYNDFERKDYVVDMHNITYRTLNFILYSYLISAYILNYLTEKEMREFLIENLFPHNLFGILKRGWELLDIELKKIGIENIQVYFNMIFEKMSVFMNNLESLDNLNKLNEFENEVNDYILELVQNKINIKAINHRYKEFNDQILNLNFQMTKEIIQENFEPTLYPEQSYPDLPFYTLSDIYDIKTFAKIFNANNENKNKYALINILINTDSDLLKNSKKMKYLKHINKLSNLLLNIYSYKITRENAKAKTLKEELPNIIKSFNEISTQKTWTEESFTNEYILPFISSWEQIKDKSVQYKCRILRDLDRGEKPLNMDINNFLSYFLVDDGDREGGMFLASAYMNFIDWQNQFIDEIISKNNMSGILNGYVSQLEKEINIQDATENEIINIDEETYNLFNDLISSYSMRNIFSKNEKRINYQNYNDIKYNFDLIEEELGKRLVPYLKKFKKDKIRFVTYFYEGFRGVNSTVLVDFNAKYKQNELIEEEKNTINKILKINNNSNFIKDIFSSLQILMNEILKENYNQNYLLYDILEKLPKYIILNEQLIKLIKDHYNAFKEKSFTINSLFSIFEYFEDLCWEEIQKNIPLDYMLDLPKNVKKYIFNYFNTISLEKKIITRINLAEALRKLISRSIAGTRQETDIKSDLELKLYINREDLWSQEILNNDLFILEIDKIFGHEIFVGHCYSLYKLIKSNDINLDDLLKEEEKEQKENEQDDKDNKNLIGKDEEEKSNLIDKDNKESKNMDDSQFSNKEFLKTRNINEGSEEEEEEMNLYQGKKKENLKSSRNKVNEIDVGSQLNLNNVLENSERKTFTNDNENLNNNQKNIAVTNQINPIYFYGQQALRGSENDETMKKNDKIVKNKRNRNRQKKCYEECKCNDICSVF